MDGFFNNPTLIEVFVYEANFISRMPVGNGLFVNININGNNFLSHKNFAIQRYVFIRRN